MAVFKSSVEVRDAADRLIGGGMTYVHVRLAGDVEQRVTGTVSLKQWEPAGEPPVSLALTDGRRLPIEVSKQVLSECSQNHILRFEASWPPARTTAPTTEAPATER